MFVRTTSRPDAAFGAVRQAVRQLDSNIPIYNLRTLDHQIDQSLLRNAKNTWRGMSSRTPV
jgi:hypothetical protein